MPCEALQRYGRWGFGLVCWRGGGRRMEDVGWKDGREGRNIMLFAS